MKLKTRKYYIEQNELRVYCLNCGTEIINRKINPLKIHGTCGYCNWQNELIIGKKDYEKLKKEKIENEETEKHLDRCEKLFKEYIRNPKEYAEHLRDQKKWRAQKSPIIEKTRVLNINQIIPPEHFDYVKKTLSEVYRIKLEDDFVYQTAKPHTIKKLSKVWRVLSKKRSIQAKKRNKRNRCLRFKV